jgi:iron complex transport system ATP-binding protein
MMLSLHEVTYRVGASTLVRDVSIDVRPGELVGVVGPNGAGKSTALRLLAGELHPTKGSVGIDGEALDRMPVRERARRRAVVAQQSELAFDFCVVDVVLLGRHPFSGGASVRVDHELAQAALRDVGLASFADRSYLSLSGGERQRVQVARSLVQLAGVPGEPERSRYWLLDEPTSALDIAHQHRLLALARDRARRGIGVLAVLHDLNLALRYVDVVVLMDRGRVFARGAPAEVLTPANLGAVYDIQAEVVAVPPAGARQLVVL